MGKQYTIIGNGSAPAKVIHEGMRDALSAGDSVGLVWTGKPSDGQEAAFDYVLDFEIEFVMYYEDGTNPPRVFRESEHGVVQKSRDPLGRALSDTTGSVLFLWEDGYSDDLVLMVAETAPDGTPILELTNGLTPIVLEEEEAEVTEAREERETPVEDDEDEEEDDTRFSYDELEIMAAAAVKRYGARLGLEGTTKKAIMEELFPPENDTQTQSMVEMAREMAAADPSAMYDPTPDEEVSEALETPREPVVVKRPEFDLEEDIEVVVEAIRNFLFAAAKGYYQD